MKRQPSSLVLCWAACPFATVLLGLARDAESMSRSKQEIMSAKHDSPSFLGLSRFNRPASSGDLCEEATLKINIRGIHSRVLLLIMITLFRVCPAFVAQPDAKKLDAAVAALEDMGRW